MPLRPASYDADCAIWAHEGEADGRRIHSGDRSREAELPGLRNKLLLQFREAMKVNAELRRLCAVPGVEPVITAAIMAFAPDLRTFASGRNFAAWLGLVPRQRSIGGKTKFSHKQDATKRHPKAFGRWRHEQDPLDLAQGRVAGQLAQQAHGSQASDGATVALANKMARII